MDRPMIPFLGKFSLETEIKLWNFFIFSIFEFWPWNTSWPANELVWNIDWRARGSVGYSCGAGGTTLVWAVAIAGKHTVSSVGRKRGRIRTTCYVYVFRRNTWQECKLKCYWTHVGHRLWLLFFHVFVWEGVGDVFLWSSSCEWMAGSSILSFRTLLWGPREDA